MKIENPTCELLAIVLYDHDCRAAQHARCRPPCADFPSWFELEEGERVHYRNMAAGAAPLKATRVI